MAASEELARRVVEAGRSCSLTTAVLEEWSRLGTPKQVEYLAGYLEAERSSREASKRATLLRRCALPAPKTFDGYDWSAVSWPEDLVLMATSAPARRTWRRPSARWRARGGSRRASSRRPRS